MKLEANKISPLQYMFAIACFIQSSSLLTSFFIPISKQESWLCMALGIAVSMPLYLIYYGITKSFPNKNIIQINEIVFGRLGGTVVSLVMIWFFVSITTYNLRDIGLFVKQTILVDTPVLAIMIVCMLVCSYAVYYGLRVVTRYGMAFTLLAIFIFAVATLLTINQWKLENFLPMFNQPVIHYVQSANLVTVIPFGEAVAFLMIAPNVKRGKKGMLRYLIGGLLIGGLTVMNVLVRDTAVLGNTMPLFTLPPFETLRMVTLTQAFSRMEILFTGALIVLLFFKISILYYISVLAIAQLFKLHSYRPLILVVGAFSVTYALFIHSSTLEHADFGRQYSPFIWMFCEFVLPLLTLIVGRLRKLQKMGIQQGTVSS